MSQHSYSRCWVHIIWSTNKREKALHKEARKRVSDYLYKYSNSKNIIMKINYVNADHVHALIDLPTMQSIEDIVKLLKGSSSHWINKERVIQGRFSWGRGYGIFSVSQSNLKKVIKYIKNQEEHHKARSFMDEYNEFLKVYEINASK